MCQECLTPFSVGLRRRDTMADDGKAPQEGLHLAKPEPVRAPRPPRPPRPTHAPKPAAKTSATAARKPTQKYRVTDFTISAGKGGSVRAVKAEYLIGFILLMLAPIADPNIKMDKNYAKRLIAFTLLFMMLFALADNKNSQVSRLATGFGGVLLLTLVVYEPTKGFGVKAGTLINNIVAHLQPGR